MNEEKAEGAECLFEMESLAGRTMVGEALVLIWLYIYVDVHLIASQHLITSHTTEARRGILLMTMMICVICDRIYFGMSSTYTSWSLFVNDHQIRLISHQTRFLAGSVYCVRLPFLTFPTSPDILACHQHTETLYGKGYPPAGRLEGIVAEAAVAVRQP